MLFCNIKSTKAMCGATALLFNAECEAVCCAASPQLCERRGSDLERDM